MGITVLVVDDHSVVAEALASRLRLEPDVARVITAYSASTAEGVLDHTTPDVILVDPDLGRDSGLDLLRRIRAKLPKVPAIVVTAHDDSRVATDAVRSGASGFVPKDAPVGDIIAAVRGALRGETYIPPRLLTDVLAALMAPAAGRNPWDERLARLTPREREVLEHMVAGHDRATIARDLFLSLNTVRTHAKNILAKLEVHSTLEAVGVALHAGMRPRSDDSMTCW